MQQILVNNVPLQLLEPPPSEVYSVGIINQPHPFFPDVQINSQHTNAVKEWVYTICMSAINIITYNGIIIQKIDINKPAHMKKDTCMNTET